MRSGDLHVACDREVPIGADMAFRADRLSPPTTEHWVLCLSSDCAAVRLTGVSPAPLGYALDRDGVLGLIFPSRVTSIHLNIASLEIGTSEWHFWVDEGHVEPELSPW